MTPLRAIGWGAAIIVGAVALGFSACALMLLYALALTVFR